MTSAWKRLKCSVVRDVLSCQGHTHLRCPLAKLGRCTPARGSPDEDDEDDRTSPRRSVSMVDISVADAKRSLESSWNHVPAPIPSLMSLLAHPAPSSSRVGTGIASLTGRKLDANRQSRRDLAKRAPSLVEQEHKKKARTPSTEEDEDIEEMVRHSQEQRQERQRSRACSKSCNRRRRRAKSQSRAPAAESTTKPKESFIPAGHEDTRREELQREAKLEREQACKDKVQERQQRGAEKAASLEERMRDEIFYHQRDYVDRATRRLKAMKLRPPTHVYAACGSSEEKPRPTQLRS